jgi:cytochrome P450
MALSPKAKLGLAALGLGAAGLAAAWLTKTRSRSALPKATLLESLAVGAGVFAPTVAKGAVIRRPKVVGMAETLGMDIAAVRTLQRLRAKHGKGPVRLAMPFRRQAVLLDPEHVRRVLDATPEPFSSESTEKRAALAHFEPDVSLISHGPDRAPRRRLNETVLDEASPVHGMAKAMLPVVDAEARVLLGRIASRSGELAWPQFISAWYRVVRRIVFGDAARDDDGITDLLAGLRADANWAGLKRRRAGAREELHRRIRAYMDRADPASLAAGMAKRASAGSRPEHQIPQWLFAFDPAAMAAFRALALLAAHPDELARAREEVEGGEAAARPHRPRLRAAVLESLRLWPTTPMILRQSTRETQWETGVMPANTGLLIFTPFFHRDDTRIAYAHSFHPDVWLADDPAVKGDPPGAWPFVPFSGGPGICPGRNLVLTLTSGMLAALLGARSLRMQDAERLAPGRLPGSLDNYSLRFRLS